MSKKLPIEVVHEVRDACLCLATQRAARPLARRFDRAFASLRQTNGQFSLMMSLNAPQAPTLGRLADALAVDRTTLTAALKSLERRELVETRPDEKDRRARRLFLTTRAAICSRRRCRSGVANMPRSTPNFHVAKAKASQSAAKIRG